MSDYSDCIIYSENQEFMPGNTVKWISNIDNRPGFEGNYSMHWHMPFDETQVPAPPAGQRVVGHPPHMHKENELMFLFGSNPEDPYDLGAEVEICLGPEMQKFTITRSCCIRIPGGTPHGFFNINRCWKPWIFVQVQEGNPKTEKFLWEYLTQAEIDSIPERLRPLWVDVGFDE